MRLAHRTYVVMLAAALTGLWFAACDGSGGASGAIDGAAAPRTAYTQVAAEAGAAPGAQIQAYLDANGITGEQTTSTGLVYVIEDPGEGAHPTVTDQIAMHYRGYLVDGSIFDRTTGESRTFPLNQLIPAWQEALPLIGRGGRIKILAPPSTAYGNRPPPRTGITPESVLVFDIELVDF